MISLKEIWSYSIKEINLLYPDAEISNDLLESKIDIASYLYHYNLLSEEDTELFKRSDFRTFVENYNDINPIDYLGTEEIIKEKQIFNIKNNVSFKNKETQKNIEYNPPILGNLKFNKNIPKVDTWQTF